MGGEEGELVSGDGIEVGLEVGLEAASTRAAADEARLERAQERLDDLLACATDLKEKVGVDCSSTVPADAAPDAITSEAATRPLAEEDIAVELRVGGGVALGDLGQRGRSDLAGSTTGRVERHAQRDACGHVVPCKQLLDSTGSKLTAAVTEVQQMAEVRFADQYVFGIVDGIGWNARQGDFRRKSALCQTRRIDGLYTLADLDQFEVALTRAAQRVGLLP